MGYWKSKVLPKIKKVFEKNGTKKAAAAAEACKSFDDSKEDINKELDEKKAELQPKVIQIYEASSADIKTLVKEPKEDGVKKNSIAVHKFLEDLVKIEFPGSKAASEASSKYGAALVPGPVFFIFEKVSTFIVTEEKAVEPPPPPAAATAADEETKEEGATVPPTTTSAAAEAEGEKTSTTLTEREIVVEEDKKQEAPAEPPAAAAAAAAKEDQPVAAEPPKP